MEKPTDLMDMYITACMSAYTNLLDKMTFNQETKLRQIFFNVPVKWVNKKWIYNLLDCGFSWDDKKYTSYEIEQSLRLAFETMVSYIRMFNHINKLDRD